MSTYVRAVFLQVLAIALLGIGLQVKQTSSQGTQGFTAQNQFDLLVSNIKTLASKLGEIHNDLCPLNCSCSQDLCQPLREGSFTCFEPRVSNETNLYHCSSLLRNKLGGNEKICSSIYVTSTKSSVTYPRQSRTSPPKPAQMRAICRTQELDNSSTRVSFTSAEPESHQELQDLKDQINSITFEPGVETKPEDFVGALNITLKAFSDAASDRKLSSDALLNIILFTDGSFTQANGGLNYSDSNVAGIISQLQARKVNLFIYGDPGKYDSDLRMLSNNVNGVKDADTFVYLKQTDIHNLDPLFSMKSYFGYLAASSSAKYNNTPLWTPPYRDAYNIGEIATVTMPAFNANKSFVGVAAIDIILDQLGSLGNAFKDIVIDQQNGLTAGTSMVSVPATFVDEPCASPYKHGQDVLCPGGSSEGDS
ncbi:hypothetical protein R1flu_025628 [Riccia fluitans]|uniref:VWFA domain-containing protein n=1 Tax=Riccia fluitans TaxID=41844 RepID=A0ABD1Y181_9MARC